MGSKRKFDSQDLTLPGARITRRSPHPMFILPGVRLTRRWCYPAFVFRQRGFYGIGPYKVGDGWRSRDVVMPTLTLSAALARAPSYPAFKSPGVQLTRRSTVQPSPRTLSTARCSNKMVIYTSITLRDLYRGDARPRWPFRERIYRSDIVNFTRINRYFYSLLSPTNIWCTSRYSSFTSIYVSSPARIEKEGRTV